MHFPYCDCQFNIVLHGENILTILNCIADESDDDEDERPRKRRMAERAAEGEMEDDEVL